jgi:hypothetical protein
VRSSERAGRGGGLAHPIRVARRLSTILVIGATLLGPHAATAAAAGGTSVVVFVDFSASVRGAERASYRFELEREILPALRPGDRIVIAPIHHRTLTAFRPLAEASLPTPPVFNGWLDNQLKYQHQVAATEKVIADARAQLNRDVTSIFARPYASPYTDIFSSLIMTEKIFAGDPRRKVLILMSDMIEDNPPHKFDKMTWRRETTEKLLAELEAKRQIADLTGVCVYVSGATAPNAELADDIARFWKAYFQRARADFDASRYAHVLLHWPPSKGCHDSGL